MKSLKKLVTTMKDIGIISEGEFVVARGQAHAEVVFTNDNARRLFTDLVGRKIFIKTTKKRAKKPDRNIGGRIKMYGKAITTADGIEEKWRIKFIPMQNIEERKKSVEADTISITGKRFDAINIICKGIKKELDICEQEIKTILGKKTDESIFEREDLEEETTNEQNIEEETTDEQNIEETKEEKTEEDQDQ